MLPLLQKQTHTKTVQLFIDKKHIIKYNIHTAKWKAYNIKLIETVLGTPAAVSRAGCVHLSCPFSKVESTGTIPIRSSPNLVTILKGKISWWSSITRQIVHDLSYGPFSVLEHPQMLYGIICNSTATFQWNIICSLTQTIVIWSY